jgi:hypothetical protein
MKSLPQKNRCKLPKNRAYFKYLQSINLESKSFVRQRDRQPLHSVKRRKAEYCSQDNQY